ncbi:hypothetical protein ISF6_2435 [Piscinibacter sakaiensis]|uniref:Uncharacterized protein n=1 Tax=Piscinibacter sakaiensis TaxID=1547922 RepID=A0A0K8P341_PISS1|nr:hypothetical protein ISF6_2435 [Piscinibacter sakaiensis]
MPALAPGRQWLAPGRHPETTRGGPRGPPRGRDRGAAVGASCRVQAVRP